MHLQAADLLMQGVKESMDVLDGDGKYYFPPEHSVESVKRRIIQIRQELLRVSQELG